MHVATRIFLWWWQRSNLILHMALALLGDSRLVFMILAFLSAVESQMAWQAKLTTRLADPLSKPIGSADELSGFYHASYDAGDH
jgi:hypothetical protein